MSVSEIRQRLANGLYGAGTDWAESAITALLAAIAERDDLLGRCEEKLGYWQGQNEKWSKAFLANETMQLIADIRAIRGGGK